MGVGSKVESNPRNQNTGRSLGAKAGGKRAPFLFPGKVERRAAPHRRPTGRQERAYHGAGAAGEPGGEGEEIPADGPEEEGD